MHDVMYPALQYDTEYFHNHKIPFATYLILFPSPQITVNTDFFFFFLLSQ